MVQPIYAIYAAVFEVQWIKRIEIHSSAEFQMVSVSGGENPQIDMSKCAGLFDYAPTLTSHSGFFKSTSEERGFEINQDFMFGAIGHGDNDEDEEDLTPPLLEEAVNLLLVNKTVMSCILVLQNRRDTGKNQESTSTELPTVIHLPLKV